MGLTLDLSPMLVNRTAVFHIGRVARDALAGEISELQYFGERRADAPKGADAERLKARLGQAIADPRRHASLTSPSGPDPGGRQVFIDPLYVLFSRLGEDDLVVINDLSPLTTPEWHSPPVAELYGYAFNKIAVAAPRLAAISHNTAQTFCANFGYPRRPIEVLHLFVPEHVEESGGRLHATRPYFLFVGSLEARKNVPGAIEAFRISGLADRGFDLLVVGGAGHGEQPALALGRATPGVVFCGFVPDEELGGFYAGAVGFLYPSYLEGFGVPLLEALRHGTPAVASATGASPEVGGDLVAYRDPDDHVGFARDMRRIADMSETERSLFAKAAKAWVAGNFTAAAYRARLLELATAS